MTDFLWSKQTMNDDLKIYFEYIENVLGVKQVYFDAENQLVVEADLLVVVQNMKSMSVSEKELLEKMIASMQIDLSLIKIIDESDLQNKKISARFVLSMLNMQQIPTVNEPNKQNTYSASVLIKQTQLKKEAWAHLQKVITFYKS